MPSETSAVNAAYIEARMKQFKLVDMREQYQELIRVASEQSMTGHSILYGCRNFLPHRKILLQCFSI